MSLSEGERIRLMAEQAVKYVSRSKPRDASEITMMAQARASSVQTPVRVAGCQDGCAGQIFGGQRTGDYTAVLQAAQHCAVCSDPDPALYPGVILPAPCIDVSAPPFAQKPASTPYICSTPGFRVYFPPKFNTCSNTQRLVLPSG